MIINRFANNEEASRFLTCVPVFASLAPQTVIALAQVANRLEFASGQVVFLEGEPARGLFVVQKGWLKSQKTSLDGREQVIRLVGPGEIFNEIGVLGEQGNLVTVITLEAALVWEIERQALLKLMDEVPQLARVLSQSLVKRVQSLFRLVEDLSLQPVEGRLARLLLEQAQAGVIQRRRWFTQAEMAAIIGTVPDVVNRSLRQMNSEGVIRMERRRIQILDQASLENKIKKGRKFSVND